MTGQPTLHSGHVVVSHEILDDTEANGQALTNYLNATPDQRQALAEAAVVARAQERSQAGEPRPLTLDTLLAKLGWSREYAAHVVQTYCSCGDDIDGWTRCGHAHDLRIEP